MRGSLMARQFLFLAVCCVSIGISGQLARAQTQPPTLPANWQQLSPTGFATLVHGYFQQGVFQSLSPVDQASLRYQGAQLFSQIDISNTSLSYQAIGALQDVGESQLDQWALAKAKSEITARKDDWTAKPYAEMFAKVMLMARLNVSESISNQEARRWVLAGGTSDQVPQNDLVYDFVRHMFGDFKVVENGFSASWVGQLKAPQSGDYTLFISPIDVNMGYGYPWAHTSMTVSVAGQELITARPPTPPDPLSTNYRPGTKPATNWVAKSNSVTLTAGTPVNLQVTVSADAPQKVPPGTLHAMLFWRGPGVATQLVPTSAVTQPQTGAPGFQATYTWTTNGQQQSVTRTDPVIDFSWTGASILLAQDPTSANQSADAMWQAMTSASFITAYASSTPVKLHPFLRDPEEVSCGLSSARRQMFLDILVQNPALLDAVDAQHAVRFFKAFRVGTPDKALKVFGTWAARQADLACALANERFFDSDTRQALAVMAILTTQQLPQQAINLQQEMLQLPDGRCSLPVAYALTYSYLGLGKLSDWMATLDAKLADPTLAGDLRVNWLLARAHAQEFTRLAPVHYPFKVPYPSSWPVDGQAYVSQALKAAQNPAVQVRAAKEIAGRLVSSGEYQSAKDFLSQLSNSLPAGQKTVVAAWQRQIDSFVAAQPQALLARQAEATNAYIQTLKARRAQAASQSDSAAVSRYDSLISAASNQQ